MSEITWPTSEYGKLLPTPKSNFGKIEKDDKTGLNAYIGKTSMDDYNEFVAACIEKGFNVDSSKTDKDYSAKNADSYKLSIEYQGNETMYISLQEPEYDIKIKVECKENSMFSKYDVDFYIDDIFVGKIKHGATKNFEYTLKKGKHSLRFENVDDDTVIGETTIDVSKIENFEFEIWCHNDNIDVDVASDLKKEESNNKDEQKTNKNEQEKSTFENAKPENLTVNNCPELAAILSNKADIDASYANFATKYKGRIIEFDGRIDYCTKHENYSTRFDYLVSAGDYNPNSQIGPSFKFENVSYYDLNTNLDTVSVGLNVRIVAEVESYNSNSGLFYLKPVSITGR